MERERKEYKEKGEDNMLERKKAMGGLRIWEESRILRRNLVHERPKRRDHSEKRRMAEKD